MIFPVLMPLSFTKSLSRNCCAGFAFHTWFSLTRTGPQWSAGKKPCIW